MGLKTLIQRVIPETLRRKLGRGARYGFFGSYSSWQDAVNDSKGYHSAVIFEKLTLAAEKVKSGEALFERDTVTFHHKEENQFVLTPLLELAREAHRELETRQGFGVLDFGGSFGNIYWQHRDTLQTIPSLVWIVIEQPHIAEWSRTHMSNQQLLFFSDSELSDVLRKYAPRVAFFGSSLQYIEEPYRILKSMSDAQVSMVILDRTPFLGDVQTKARIVIQKVRPDIYDASYPAHIFNQKELTTFMEAHGYILTHNKHQGFMALDGYERVELRGLIFKK